MRHEHLCSCYEWILPNWQMLGQCTGSATLLRSWQSSSTEADMKSRQAQQAWESFGRHLHFFLDCTTLPALLSTMKRWQKPQTSARRFSSLFFFGLCVSRGDRCFQTSQGLPFPVWVKLHRSRWSPLLAAGGEHWHRQLGWGKATPWKVITTFSTVIKT